VKPILASISTIFLSLNWTPQGRLQAAASVSCGLPTGLVALTKKSGRKPLTLHRNPAGSPRDRHHWSPTVRRRFL